MASSGSIESACWPIRAYEEDCCLAKLPPREILLTMVLSSRFATARRVSEPRGESGVILVEDERALCSE